ncbi:hypothetical protein P7C73_g4204, partial [Tremellales sp. Uapishka_1]
MAPTLTLSAKAGLQATLDELATSLPGCHVSIATTDGIIYQASSGQFDVLDTSATAQKASADDVLWFASTTKLLTAVCYLSLIDKGVVAFDTPISDLYPPLKEASRQIYKGLDAEGKPIFEANSTKITLGMMLNQTSGFGAEFQEKVMEWKTVTQKGKGFVNSCKVENLIHTPIVYEPGTQYEYGNSAEWLGLILPELVHQSTESYLQENVCRPLKMGSTTFYPDNPAVAARVMPLRWGEISDSGAVEWQTLTDQLPLLTLPRKEKDIEYPVAGGGIFSNTTDYVTLLQYLLAHYLSLNDPSIVVPTKILSDASVASLFHRTLPDSAKDAMCEMFNGYIAVTGEWRVTRDEVDWSTGMCIYLPSDGRQREGWGRHGGSVGWGGAAGTEYWIDPKYGVACVFTTQMLPGNGPNIKDAKKVIEKAIYHAFESSKN